VAMASKYSRNEGLTDRELRGLLAFGEAEMVYMW
jgi:hypothetical protein